jgi:hypothetical protein
MLPKIRFAREIPKANRAKMCFHVGSKDKYENGRNAFPLCGRRVQNDGSET